MWDRGRLTVNDKFISYGSDLKPKFMCNTTNKNDTSITLSSVTSDVTRWHSM